MSSFLEWVERKLLESTTEEHFQSQLDANPNDWQTRLVFADWLDEHDDPRAEGYRALGKLQIFPHVFSRTQNEINQHPDCTENWCYGSINNSTHGKEYYFRSLLPHEWMTEINSTHNIPIYSHSTEKWKYHNTRQEADDQAALAFARLPENIRTEILSQSEET